MQLFNVLIWNNLYLLRYCTILSIILLGVIIWINNIYGLKSIICKNLKKFRLHQNTKFYWIIFLKHLNEKKYLITILFLITILLVFANFYFKNHNLINSLLGVSASALVTVTFLDSINQYVTEKKFIDVTNDIRNKIYALYSNLLDIILLLNKQDLAKEKENYYRNTKEINNATKELAEYCKNTTFKHNKELVINDKINEYNYACEYIRLIKNKVNTIIIDLESCSSNLEIYSLLFYANKLREELNIVNDNFFKYDPKDIGSIFGGITDSFIRNIIEKYQNLLEQLEENKPLQVLNKELTKEFICMVEIPQNLFKK